MHEIPATWMRGGTSKCWVFRRADLQIGDLSMDDVLLRIYGSPDHRQVDGIGGGTSTTSKAVILAPSELDGVDVEYTFAQIGIDEAKVDWGSNCGNCSAVVASFAIREGWVPANDGETTVRVLNTNADQLIVQRVDTPGAQLLEAATENIPASRSRVHRSGWASSTRPVAARVTSSRRVGWRTRSRWHSSR